MTPPSPFKSHPTAWPIGVLSVAMVSSQCGAALVKQLFPAVGVSGATALRLALASLMLAIVWRPWRPVPTARAMRSILIYGAAMGLMNLLFYSSLERIPLGIAVALEFTGPLAVAIAASHRSVDFLWIVVAAAGIVALLPHGPGPPGPGPHGPGPPGPGPPGPGPPGLPAAGIAYALGAGVCWALYIVFGQKAGSAHGGATAALGTMVGAALILPVGVAHAGAAMFSPTLLPTACGVALLSSALPYSLEMYALTRLPARTFGVLMSAQPALGALSGLCFLGERLTVIQWTAIAGIMIASGGSAAGSGSAQPTSATAR